MRGRLEGTGNFATVGRPERGGGVVASSRWRPVERGGGLYDMGGACSAASRACEAAERGAWSRRTLPPAVEGRVAGSEPAEAEAVRGIGLDGLNLNGK